MPGAQGQRTCAQTGELESTGEQVPPNTLAPSCFRGAGVQEHLAWAGGQPDQIRTKSKGRATGLVKQEVRLSEVHTRKAVDEGLQVLKLLPRFVEGKCGAKVSGSPWVGFDPCLAVRQGWGLAGSRQASPLQGTVSVLCHGLPVVRDKLGRRT